jgi:hypothetical protein
MKPTFFAAAAALALIGASIQPSFAQPQDGWSGGQWRNQAANQNQPPGPPHRWGPPPPAQTAAKFVFRHGRSRVAVTCPQADSLQDCIHAATALANNLTRIHEQAQKARQASGGNNAGAAKGNGNDSQ